MGGLRIRNPQDFWSGVLFVVFGLGAVILARSYTMGTAGRMGPAYFPTILGGLLAILGVVIAFKALQVDGEAVPKLITRPLLVICISVLTFAGLVRYAGLIPAIFSLVVLAAAARRDIRPYETLISAIVLAVLSVALFVWGLNLPFKLFGAG